MQETLQDTKSQQKAEEARDLLQHFHARSSAIHDQYKI